MRLSELLGLEVRGDDGTYVGTVADAVLTQDGPMRGPYSAGLRLTGLILVEHRHVRLLGYDRDTMPWLQRALVDRLAGRILHVRWEDVLLRDDGLLQVRAGAGPLREHDSSLRRRVGQ